MWNHAKLLELAAAEDKAFLDARMDRLYYAMCRSRGSLLDRPISQQQAVQELAAALDALALDDIRRHMISPESPDGIYEEMLALKQKRLVEQPRPIRQARQPVVPVDDSEPEQNQ